MWAVLSDIHGNLEALDAVLADSAKHSVSHIFCLGDLIGYGPNPVECIEKAMAWDVVLLGDYDQDVINPTEGFAPRIRAGQLWTRQILEGARREDLWDFLAKMQRSHTEGDFLLVHGSPRNPVNEYHFPEDIYNTRKMTRIGELLDRYCFCGHTHVPGVFIGPDEPDAPWQYLSTEELPGFHRLNGRKTIINVGSVGQPRDGNWRACYVLVDGWDITFRRIEYDWQKTRDKIRAIPDIDDIQGDRLGEGQ